MNTLSWMEILLLSLVIATSVSGWIGFRMGHEVAEKKEIDRLRDKAIEACIANHPAGKARPALRVVQNDN